MLGTAILVLGFLSGLTAIVAYGQAAAGRRPSLRIGRSAFLVSCAAIAAAAALLLTEILRHNFANAYVWGYSDRSLPLHYLISTFYAGQEGSFLFWGVSSAVLGLFLLRYTRPRGLEAHVMTVFAATQTFLLVLLLFKSPFRSIWDAFPGQLAAGQVPADGRGLNPLLENFWMVIHPPVLFIGFSAMAVPFSFAVAALWRKEFNNWMNSAMPWILFGGIVLGSGIMLGAYWAYGVLGWGGYWGWDPVENSSLIPWLTSVALLHTLIVQKRTGHLVRTNFALAIVTYVLVLYSTFLTRSGILGDSSVHSFTDPGAAVYGLLLAFVVIFAIAGFGSMILRRRELKAAAVRMRILSRGFALALGAIALLASAAVVFFGTSLPIFTKTALERSFYDSMNLPIVIAAALLIGFSLQLKWENEDGSVLLRRSLKWGIASVLVTAAIAYVGVHDWTLLLLAFSCVFALFVNAEVAYVVVRADPRMMGGKIAHIGLALFLLGVLASGHYDSEKTVSLTLNSPRDVFGYTLEYRGNRPIEGNKYAFDVDVRRAGESFTLSPVMFETKEQGLLRNPDIKTFAEKDFYLSPVSLEQTQPQALGGEIVVLKRGEAHSFGDVTARFVKFDMGSHGKSSMMSGGGTMSVGSVLEVSSGRKREIIVPTAVYGQGGAPTYAPVPSKLLGAEVRLVGMNVDMSTKQSAVTIEVMRPGSGPAPTESLVVEASIKPFMNLVWSGTILLFVGIFVSLLQRKREA